MRHKRGDKRIDGKLFWQYKTGGIREVWHTPERFEEVKNRTAKRMSEYLSKNAEHYSAKKKDQYQKNKDKILSYMKERYAVKIDQIKAYRSSDKVKKRKRMCQMQKYRNDPIENISARIRARLREALRGKGYTKKSQTNEIIGCTWDFLKAHIENQFKEGMGWHNRNLWHLDHIIPIASAKTEDDIMRLNHYTNLRPLWAKENLQKSSKY
jgi:hypothetical protein